jgi:ABC-type oligopeptide transport system substrate-binding subunit/DNA-binding SARP family transcriptional activator
MSERLRLTLLGRVDVCQDGAPVTGFYSAKAQALLYYLAVTGISHSRSALAGLLWADVPEANARASLRQVIANLRRLVGSHLNITRRTVAFNRDSPYWLDVEAFLAGVTGASDTVDEAGVEQLQEAVELYRGDFLAGFYVRDAPLFEEWMLAQQAQLRMAALGALHKLAAHYTRSGDYENGINTTRRLLALEPWHEEAHRHLMLLLARSGQRGAALAQYETCCRVLKEEVGVEPSDETTALYEQIQAGGLGTPTEPAWPALGAGTPLRLPAFLDKESQPVERARPVFVARERELARLIGYLEAVLGGQGRVVFLSGEAGSGKTALLQEFARHAQEAHPELVVAAGGCNAFSGIGDPYLPFRDVLGMLTGDIESRWAAGAVTRAHARRLWAMLPQAVQALLDYGPHLIDSFVPGRPLLNRAALAMPAETDNLHRLKTLIARGKTELGGLEQDHLFKGYTGVLRALAAQHPLLLLLDDMQWADAASIGLLFYLGRRLAVAGSRVMIVSAYRPDEVALGRPSGLRQTQGETMTGQLERHPLEKVLAEFKRHYGDVRVDLTSAQATQGREFVDAFLDAEPNRLDEAFRGALFRRTRGHPLFTVELLRAMQERGDLTQDEKGHWVTGPALDWETLPARIEGVIEERLGRLTAEAYEILSLAAVEGEVFTAQVLARVQHTPGREVFWTLSQELLTRHRLVRAVADIQVEGQLLSRYEFAHALFQQYLYNALSADARRLLHSEIAVALEALYSEQMQAIAPRLAWHFAECGDAEKAVTYLLLAGDRARLLYAHQEAVSHYQQALTFLNQQGDYERAARTLMKLGLTYHSAFDFRSARLAYEEGFAAWQQARIVEAIGERQPAPHPLRVDWRDPLTLDPTRSGNFWSAGVIGQLFCGLVEFSPEMEILPEVASTWEVLENGCKYVFHLRDGARWSDGASVTAGDFEYAWKRVLSNPGLPLASLLLYDIKNARAFHRGEISNPDQVGVHALDETTLAVELEEPTAYFLHVLAHPATCPVPRHAIKAFGEAWINEDNLVTNGPFRLEVWQPGELMRFSWNPLYRGRLSGNLQEVELSLITDPLAKLALYETDALDVFRVWFLPPQEMNRARQQYAEEYISAPQLTSLYVGFDVTRPPFNDRRVRQAFVLAADKETHVEVVRSGQFTLATGGFVPTGMPGHSPEIGLPYDPGKARQLLAAAGYPDGRGFPTLEFLGSNFRAEESEQLAGCWRRNLGVEVQCSISEAEISSQVLDETRPHLFFNGWAADYPDPDSFLRLCMQATQSGWRNRAYERLVTKARRATDQRTRMGLYRRADRILVEEAVIMPLTYARAHLLVKPWVRRYPISVMRGRFWKDVIIGPH